MVGKAESSSNPPLWVNLDFKITQIPSLVDTGAEFSYIRKDVVVTCSLRFQLEEMLM